ncbi:MAG: hypothetical protein NTZ35_11620 [Ignavibacteriales bacterium]|nr:hypothetical protein [Ignavibacteriales bacterium]
MVDHKVNTRMPVKATVGFTVFAALVITIGFLYYRDETSQYHQQVGIELDAYDSLKNAKINRCRNERLADEGSLSQSLAFADLYTQ